MHPPFLLTQSRNLHNDSMWKQIESNTLYKIVVVRTYALNFFNTLTPPRPWPRLLNNDVDFSWSCSSHRRPWSQETLNHFYPHNPYIDK